MAYGNTNPYDLQNVGFQQIMGAGQGGQDLQSLIQGLYGTLREGGYYGAGEKGSLADVGGGHYENLAGTSQTENLWGMEGLLPEGQGEMSPYMYQDFMGSLEKGYGGGVLTDPSEHQKGMQSLLELLKSVDIPGMQKEYGQDIGDVRSEVGAQMQGLKKGLTMGGKSGRYSGISAPRRNLSGGGRQQYMSDYYGLQEKQYEMERDMQKSMEEDLYSQVGQYMQLNPVV